MSPSLSLSPRDIFWFGPIASKRKRGGVNQSLVQAVMSVGREERSRGKLPAPANFIHKKRHVCALCIANSALNEHTECTIGGGE